jgi:hypothetical protein
VNTHAYAWIQTMQRAAQKEEQNEQSMLFYRVSWFCELINKGPGNKICLLI